ncbi:MAG: DUF1700 domain-containing protein [Eubacteriales bacterium]|nr:DUF1700 domain-containing protein [Eubacteriales bacterium]
MTKNEFISALREKLKGYPKEDIERSAEYYCEIIDDRIEDGMSEEDAVSEIGSVNDAAAQAVSGISLPKIIKERISPSHELRIWEIILIALGSPIWFSLCIAAICVFFSVYAVIWSLVIAMFATELALVVSVPACIVAAFGYLISGTGMGCVLSIGIALLCAGIAVVLFIANLYIVKTTLRMSKRFLNTVKSFFVRKDEVK